MSRTAPRTVDDYLAAQPDTSRAVLAKVRRAIAQALPKADETISYKIPTYKLNGRAVIYFAGWKKHYSLYPVDAATLAALGGRAARCEVEKGTVRFSYQQPVPATLIARIAKLRAKLAAPRGPSRTTT